MPRFASFMRVAGQPVILRIASGSGSTPRSVTYFAITLGKLPKLPLRSTAFEMGLARPAPRLGEHTREVLAELGLAPDEIDALASRKVIP